MRKTFVFIILIITILSFGSTSFATQILENTTTMTYSEIGTPDTNALNIYSSHIVMIERETGDILFEKNANEKMFPASTTKILTAILVLENCDLNDIATVSSVALKAVPPTYTTSNIQVRRKT